MARLSDQTSLNYQKVLKEIKRSLEQPCSTNDEDTNQEKAPPDVAGEPRQTYTQREIYQNDNKGNIVNGNVMNNNPVFNMSLPLAGKEVA